jgi:hypothetical protein
MSHYILWWVFKSQLELKTRTARTAKAKYSQANIHFAYLARLTRRTGGRLAKIMPIISIASASDMLWIVMSAIARSSLEAKVATNSEGLFACCETVQKVPRHEARRSISAPISL